MLKNPSVINWLNGNKDGLDKTQEDELFNDLYPELISNHNKYGIIGESLFSEYLSLLSNNLSIISHHHKINNFILDFKLENTYYEIKTRRYNMPGTAGEKILNVPHKYRNILKEGESLYIVLIAYQEIDSQDVFATDERNMEYIQLWSKHHIHFVKFTDLLKRQGILIEITSVKDKHIDLVLAEQTQTFKNENTVLDNLLSQLQIPKLDLKASPPVKWVGGKSKLLNHIIPKLLSKLSTSQIYFEPFIGGGSVFIELMNNNFNGIYILNDINTNIINMFKIIKQSPTELITELEKYKDKLNPSDYTIIRDEFNSSFTQSAQQVYRTKVMLQDQLIRRTAMFMYLNKTCFRGLYRVNKQGKFNVPYGNYKVLNFDYDNIRNLSTLINSHNVYFLNTQYYKISYEKILSKFNSSSVVTYFDPPYIDTFDSYDSTAFNYKEFTERVNTLKHPFILSNSASYISHVTRSDVSHEIIAINDRINSKSPSSVRKELLVWTNDVVKASELTTLEPVEMNETNETSQPTEPTKTEHPEFITLKNRFQH